MDKKACRTYDKQMAIWRKIEEKMRKRERAEEGERDEERREKGVERTKVFIRCTIKL